MDFLLLLVIQGALVGGLCSYVASQKNRSTGNWFVLGFLFSIFALIALAAIPALSKSGDIQPASVIAFDGDRDISASGYQLFLVRRFGIEKNATLEKYIIGDDVFKTLEDALSTADAKYGGELAQERVKAELLIHEEQSQAARRTQQQLSQVELLMAERKQRIADALSNPKLLNAFDEQGRTPLMHAIESQDSGAIKALVAAGARIDQWGNDRDGRLQSIKDMAKKNGVSLL